MPIAFFPGPGFRLDFIVRHLQVFLNPLVGDAFGQVALPDEALDGHLGDLSGIVRNKGC